MAQNVKTAKSGLTELDSSEKLAAVAPTTTRLTAIAVANLGRAPWASLIPRSYRLQRLGSEKEKKLAAGGVHVRLPSVG
jgi:hypothetical protein